jgi:hypothetical protein
MCRSAKMEEVWGFVLEEAAESREPRFVRRCATSHDPTKLFSSRLKLY